MPRSSPTRPWTRQVRAAKGLFDVVRDDPTMLVDVAKGLVGRGSEVAPVAGPAEGPTHEPSADLDAYDRTVAAWCDVDADAALTMGVVQDLARLADWMTMHVTFRGTPPAGAVEGVEFAEQVRLMGIPADIRWVVAAADGEQVVLAGTGPMSLTIGLWFTVRPHGDRARVWVDAGIGGDPVKGPLGVSVARSVQEAMTESLATLAQLVADVPEGATGSRRPVRHERSGRLLDPSTPVLVGAGQVVLREPDLDDLPDPATLSARALGRAADDAGPGRSLLERADAVYAVASASWTYRDQARAVSDALGLDVPHTLVSAAFGGDAGQALVNDAARAVAEGELDVVLISGAEVGSTMAAAQKAGRSVEWPAQDAAVAPERVVGSEREANTEAELAAGLGLPVRNYALMESALRSRAGRTPQEHLDHVTGLWSDLSQVAAANPYAWQPTAMSPQELATTGADNRMISSPYPKLLCANLQVDLASGLVLCSVAAAQEAGVPQDRWVFPLVGAGAYDEWFVSERAELDASPAIRAIGQAALTHAGLDIDDVEVVDLYSCFPAAVQIAARELGLPVGDPARPLSLTGGLTFGGGPGNNYGGHAIATLVHRLRERPDAVGLSTSLGWYATKHALGLYSATPPERPYAALHPVLSPEATRPVPTEYAGPGVVEACTVEHGRDGEPAAAILAVVTPDGSRVLVRSAQADVLRTTTVEDPLHRTVDVASVEELVFTGTERVGVPPPPEPTVLVERRGPVTVITLNRPEQRNAIDPETADRLERVVDAFEADPAARVAVLTGAGGTFCAGMDLKAAAQGRFAMTERRGPLGISALPITKPVIAAVEGHALAGGCELALVADLVVASTTSELGIPEVKRGLVAAAGGVLRLAQRLPRNVAMELALTGEPMPAARLAELGLVNRLAEPGEVLAAALDLADRIVANAPLSVAVSRRIVVESPGWSAEEEFARQSELAGAAVTSADATEGVRAFAEKREPVWQGR